MRMGSMEWRTTRKRASSSSTTTRPGKTSVDSATALRENLIQNLEQQIERIEAHRAAGHEIPHADNILKMLKEVKAAAHAGKGWPGMVKLYVYGASGRVKRLARKLVTPRGELKIEFKSWKDLTKARKPWYQNPAAKKAIQDLDKEVLRLEKEAAEAIIKREARELATKKIEKVAAQWGVKFVEKRLPKLIAEGLLKRSAKAAARRALSLAPVVGWGLDAQDAYHGIEDIFRGHVARGFAGIGLAVGDVAADFLYLGDAISGVWWDCIEYRRTGRHYGGPNQD
jgi:hypothetical protein